MTHFSVRSWTRLRFPLEPHSEPGLEGVSHPLKREALGGQSLAVFLVDTNPGAGLLGLDRAWGKYPGRDAALGCCQPGQKGLSPCPRPYWEF